MLWPRKGSLIKTQTRILDNRLYYTRKIESHRKGKKSRTVRITPILICSICCSPHLTGNCGTRPFFKWVRAQDRSPHAPGISKNAYGTVGIPYPGRLSHRAMNPTRPKGVKALGKAPWGRRKSPGTETHSARSVPQITRPAKVLPGSWRGSDRYWSTVFDARPTLRACMAQGLFWVGPGAGP